MPFTSSMLRRFLVLVLGCGFTCFVPSPFYFRDQSFIHSLQLEMSYFWDIIVIRVLCVILMLARLAFLCAMLWLMASSIFQIIPRVWTRSLIVASLLATYIAPILFAYVSILELPNSFVIRSAGFSTPLACSIFTLLLVASSWIQRWCVWILI